MDRTVSKEHAAHAKSGFGMLFFEFLLLCTVIVLFAFAKETKALSAIPTVVGLTAVVMCVAGFFFVEPTRSRVPVLFGTYRGTVRQPGFYWVNPFTRKRTVSLRAHNLNGQKLKVNDLIGNPIEIAGVIVWQVRDTAQAAFDVENF